MFLDNLSWTVLCVCGQKRLTYECASELCGLSSRHFGNIVRGNTNLTVNTLEKLCYGLDMTPNELLLSAELQRCPGCGGQMEDLNQSLCCRCREILDAAYSSK